MNIGIIGAGFMGSVHARAINGLFAGSLAGIAAKTSTRAASLAAELHTECFDSVGDLIRESDIDIIDICAPTSAHARLACECMEAGKHVIVEYPLCETREELDRLLRVSKETGRVCAGAYYSRFQSQYKYFFELSKTGKIGSIRTLNVSRRSAPVFSSGDIVNDLMAQDIDFAVRLLGTPNSLSCANRGEEHCVLVFAYDSAIVTIEGSTDMHDGYPFTTRHFAAGTTGSLVLDWSFVDRPKSRFLYADKDGESELTKDDYDPYVFELERIVKGIASKRTEEFDIASLYESAALTFACRERMR